MQLPKFAIFFIVSSYVSSKLQLSPRENIIDCTKSGKSKFMDWTGLEYDPVNDTLFYLTGEIKFLKEVKSPWKVHVYIEKFDREEWHIALLDLHVTDFCQEIQNPQMPWFFLTSKFQKKECPFPAGHTEIFEKGPVYDPPENASYSLVGKYRFTAVSMPSTEKECFQGGFELAEA